MKKILQKWTPVVNLREYTHSQNLGQTWKGVRRFWCTDESGKNRGIGYSFEDVTSYRWKAAGKTVEQVDATLNGADFIVDGVPCQLKCGKNAYSSGKSFYEAYPGPFKYADQVAVVPKGQGSKVQTFFNHQKNMGRGSASTVVESPVTRAEAEKYLHRGLTSLVMDLKDHEFQNICGRNAVVIIGLATAAGITDVYIHRKQMSKGEAAKRVGKWVAGGAGLTVLACGAELVRRQFLRIP